MTDELELLKSGDEDTFERFILKYRKQSILFARKIVRDYYIAEDIVQDSFAAFYVYRNRLKKYSTAKSYLFSIIHNKAVDYIRKNNNISIFDFEINDTLSPEKIILDKEEKEILMNNFNKLKDKYKKVLYLYAFENMSYKEIGDILNMNLPQVKINIFRARRKLKNSMINNQFIWR